MLSTEQLNELIALIQTTRIGGPAPVRRAQRIPHPGEVSIVFGSDENAGPPTHVTLRDISPRGMCFDHPDPIAPGTPFIVRLADATGRGVSMACAVVHCRELPSGEFMIGSEFKALQDENLVPYERAPEDLICTRRRE